MAQTGNRVDPFPAFRFQVAFDGLAEAGFSECGGLQLEVELQPYPEGGLNDYIRQFPGRVKQSTLTLKRGIVDRAMWDWFYNLSQGQVVYRHGTITVRDPSGGQIVAEWRFKRAFPSKWQGPELNAAQNAIAVETLELAHHGLERLR